jgi:malonyl CoA-acyl carrier protein transacylase
MDQLNKIAVVFPAFGIKYLGDEILRISYYGPDLIELSLLAKEITGFNPDLVLENHDGAFSNELDSQIASYIISAASSNVVRRHGICGRFAAGYSMGIYAALYHAGVYDFATGLNVLIKAYNLVCEAGRGSRFLSGQIAGLDRKDISSIISGNNLDVEIINENNHHSLAVCGSSEDIETIMRMARENGALNTTMLPTTCPYHTRTASFASIEFGRYLLDIAFASPFVPIVSAIDCRIIDDQVDVKRELSSNLNSHINWHNLMRYMTDEGVISFIECGPGKSLSRMARFIDGDFAFYPMTKWRKFIPKLADYCIASK